MSNGRWAGRRWLTLGDSITAQDAIEYGSTGVIARGYQTIVKEKLGFEAYDNLGVSGRAMANGTKNGFGTNTSGRTVPDYSVYDLVTIAAGTNDFKLNVALGVLGVNGDSEFDTTTFYGAYRDLIEYILKSSPTVRLVLFTPLQRNNDGYDVYKVNGAGHKLIDYRHAIIALGEMYALPVCDMYANSGITQLTFSAFTLDGLHPNDVGYERMGSYAAAFLEGI